MANKKKQPYWVELSVRPANNEDDPGFSVGMRVEDIEWLTEPWMIERYGNSVWDADTYLKRNGYK